jgi:hypothetical protein
MKQLTRTGFGNGNGSIGYDRNNITWYGISASGKAGAINCT